MRTITILAALIAFSSEVVLPASDDGSKLTRDENVIVIRGHRKEITRPLRAGQSIVIRPDDETRFDTRTHLRNEANLTLPDTGRISASGFTLPRVRGQDARFTEIYLEGLRIQDPYVGFPFIDDLDLRACGEMDIFIGNPPPSIPTINPNGAIAYRMFTPSTRGNQAGTIVGKPYGTAVWALSRYQSESGLDLRLYGREHWTSGKFSYYDDNATPYNNADDHYDKLKHNDRRGRQILPSFVWQRDGHKVSGLMLWNDTKTSLPARLSSSTSYADEYSQHRVGRLGYNYEPEGKHFMLPANLGFELGRFVDDIQVVDPTTAVLAGTQYSARHLVSASEAVSLKWNLPFGEDLSQLYFRAETSATEIAASNRTSEAYNINRSQKNFYTGSDMSLPFNMHMELKAMVTRLEDGVAGDRALDSLSEINKSAATNLHGTSAGLAWKPKNIVLYGQWSRIMRPPTLLEKFGDGALIRDNTALNPESTLHQETGAQWSCSDFSSAFSFINQISLRFALFRDNTRDRITLLPSLAQTMRAQNAVRTQIDGIEIASDISFLSTTLGMGYAHMEPDDFSIPERIRLIPGVPEDVGVVSLSHSISVVTLRWATRYQSQVWRDSDNSIAVPGYTIHDATVDAKGSTFSLGFGLYNVTDQRRLAINGVGTRSNEGYTAYSDYSGMPLPGRQWRVSLSASF